MDIRCGFRFSNGRFRIIGPSHEWSRCLCQYRSHVSCIWRRREFRYVPEDFILFLSIRIEFRWRMSFFNNSNIDVPQKRNFLMIVEMEPTCLTLSNHRLVAVRNFQFMKCQIMELSESSLCILAPLGE